MKTLLNEHKKYALADLSEDNLKKVKGEIKPGQSVRIKWKDYPGVDIGYCFALPISDDSMNDYFIHVPSPTNEGGIGDVPGEFHHINYLLLNSQVKKIEFY